MKLAEAPEPEADELPRMTLLQHLEELRRRIVYSLIAVVGAFLLCWGFAEPIFHFLAVPVYRFLPPGSKLTFLSITEPFMIYLKDPRSGGETRFPTLGMKVMPRQGRAVVWNNLRGTGEGNDATRHQSLPVTGGTKTIITKWFRMPKGRIL